jgi:hypothetical protein
MIQNQEESILILNLKLILYSFETMSGMKINYHKSEVFVIEEEEQIHVEIAERLNCMLGQFSLTYLGIPIHTGKLRKCDLQVVNVKIGKRVEPWQGKLLSSGGRLILVNSYLSSIPTYLMGFD